MKFEFNLLLVIIAILLLMMTGWNYLPFPMPRDTLWFTVLAALGAAVSCCTGLAVLAYRDTQIYSA